MSIAKKPITEEIKTKIEQYIKNRQDISSFLHDYNLQGLNLSYSIIENVNCIGENLSNTNFSNSVIGIDGNTTVFINCNLKGSNFKNTRFEGKTWMKHCDLRNCNFTGAFLPYVEYQYSDLRGISLCETVFRLGVKCGYKSRFDPDIFTNLCKYLDMDTSKEK